MRAKLIDEKFQQVSDPIHDMGIGGAEIDINQEFHDINMKANIQKNKIMKQFLGKIVEGTFYVNHDFITMKFRVKSIKVDHTGILTNQYKFQDENGDWYPFKTSKIKVWG